MLIGSELRPSSIHGIGVFSTEAVCEGQLIWRFDSRIDRIYSEDEIASLPDRTREFLRTYSTWNEDVSLWVLCGDNARHFNHSDTPNSISRGIAFGEDFAACDIPAGTELTSDYNTICDAVRNGGSIFTGAYNIPSSSSSAS